MINHDALLRLLHYCPTTGQFHWLADRGPQKVGEIAGGVNSHGYVQIRICGLRIKAHRLAWFYIHRQWPVSQVDHINRNKADNRLSNLREASPQENRVNSTRPTVVPRSGLKGVEEKRGRFVAAIRVNGRRVHLGTFSSPAQASAAYQAAAERAFGSFVPEGAQA